MAYPVQFSSQQPRGREALIQSIGSIQRTHGDQDVLFGYAPYPETIHTDPRPDRARTPDGAELILPEGGFRAFRVADVAILFAIRNGSRVGAHGDLDLDGNRRITLMAETPGKLHGVLGKLVIVSADLFDPLREDATNITYVCQPEDTRQVEVYDEILVSSDDLRLPVFEVNDPVTAFYEERDLPDHAAMIRRPAELLEDPILPQWLNLGQ